MFIFNFGSCQKIMQLKNLSIPIKEDAQGKKHRKNISFSIFPFYLNTKAIAVSPINNRIDFHPNKLKAKQAQSKKEVHAQKASLPFS